jgi:hypothetical protein
MKKNLTLFCAGVLMSALCAGSVACNEPKEPQNTEQQGGDVPFSVYSPTGEASVGEFSAKWVNLNYENSGKGKIIVIDSDKELRNYIEGDYPSVDFSKKTLLLAYGHESGTAFGDDVKFRQVSDRNYIMTVYGEMTLLAAMVRWQFAIVVDKLPSGSKIELNTIITNLP